MAIGDWFTSIGLVFLTLAFIFTVLFGIYKAIYMISEKIPYFVNKRHDKLIKKLEEQNVKQ